MEVRLLLVEVELHGRAGPLGELREVERELGPVEVGLVGERARAQAGRAGDRLGIGNRPSRLGGHPAQPQAAATGSPEGRAPLETSTTTPREAGTARLRAPGLARGGPAQR